MIIPKQLKPYRFCRIPHKSKIPNEFAWNMLEEDYEQQPDGSWKHKENGALRVVKIDKKSVVYKGPITNYSYDVMQRFLDWNYGTLNGILRILDDDTKEQILIKLYYENFPPTFRVRNHIYFEFTNGYQEKIIFFDKGRKHCGELQGKGVQCVGPGSVHPSGEVYDLREDLPIVKIDYDKFMEVFKDYIPKKKVVRPRTNINFNSDSLTDIPISNIISSDKDKCPSCGCATGTNFKVYPETNSYFCFHSHTGGSIWEIIAIIDGIKTCSEIGSGCLTESESKEIRDIAIQKYGLKVLERQEEFKPRGWALGINIKKMAERRGLTICSSCNLPFEFDERLGWYKCSSCGIKGDIKKFAALFIK